MGRDEHGINVPTYLNYVKETILTICGLLILSGCATVEMTNDARYVRELTQDAGLACEFRGVHDTTSPAILGMADDNWIESMKNTVRNETAARGANAFMIVSYRESGIGFSGIKVQYQAFACGA